MKFLASSAIFLFAQLPVMLLSFIVVPFMLLSKWDGKTTWFGNFKWGRGDAHYKAPSNGEYWKQLHFLCWRNPVSNFGKFQLAVDDKPWVWLIDAGYKRVRIMYGWKLPSGEMPTKRTYVFRPYVVKSGH